MLDPPLGAQLAGVIAIANEFIADDGATQLEGYNSDAAHQIIDAVIEHGYRA